MKMTKLAISSLYGIKEFSLEGQSVELAGRKGAGKTSVIDAIRIALTNKSPREYVVRNGDTEAEILIETDTGIRINRKYRTNQADYKSIKENGHEVGSPEAFLREIFTPLQLNPVEFMNMTKNQQNAIILDMLEYPWDLNKIKEWFGEIPAWVSYDQNILQVLNDIQSEKGEYYILRQDINRDIRNKSAFIEDIGASLPVNYNADFWEKQSAGDLYTKIEKIRKENQTIERAKILNSGRENKIRKFEADKEISLAALNTEFSNRQNQIETDIIKLQEQIKALQVEKDNLGSKKADKVSVIEQTYKANIAKFDAELQEYAEYLDKEPEDTLELQKQAEEIEKMKAYINEYRRMVNLQSEVEQLNEETQLLTQKIEKARTLPGEILANCTIPISGLTVEKGIPLINGLPVSNLSDGEKLDLCIDVAVQNPAGLQIVLIDGVEKLDSASKTKLYQKCKDKGLQFIATRTTDDPDLTVIEL